MQTGLQLYLSSLFCSSTLFLLVLNTTACTMHLHFRRNEFFPRRKKHSNAISTVKKMFKELFPFGGRPAVAIANLNVGMNCIHERKNDEQEGDQVGTHDPLLAREFPRHWIIRLCCSTRRGQRCASYRKARSGGCCHGSSSGQGCNGEASCTRGQAKK